MGLNAVRCRTKICRQLSKGPRQQQKPLEQVVHCRPDEVGRTKLSEHPLCLLKVAQRHSGNCSLQLGYREGLVGVGLRCMSSSGIAVGTASQQQGGSLRTGSCGLQVAQDAMDRRQRPGIKHSQWAA